MFTTTLSIQYFDGVLYYSHIRKKYKSAATKKSIETAITYIRKKGEVITMEMTLRWYGSKFDTVTLEQIRQIPGVTGVITTLYDTKPGEVWSQEPVSRYTM